MDNQRAYSILTVKAMQDDERVIEGIASTPSADRMGDIVEPLGAKFAVPMPLLWQHDHHSPVGHVEFAKPTDKGIPFKARLVHPDAVDSPELKNRLQLAWDSIKTKLVAAVSIGFRPLEWSIMDDGGWRFTDWEWLELSAVTIPANAEATITTIKSLDREVLLTAARAAHAGADTESDGDGGAAESAEPAAPRVRSGHIVKLHPPAPEAEPYVIQRIHREA